MPKLVLLKKKKKEETFHPANIMKKKYFTIFDLQKKLRFTSCT